LLGLLVPLLSAFLLVLLVFLGLAASNNSGGMMSAHASWVIVRDGYMVFTHVVGST
jgi:hypothetical protein